MGFDNFLAELIAFPDADVPQSDIGIENCPLRITYDPLRTQSSSEEILIGVGAWGSATEPVSQRGFCLNNKGTAVRWCLARDYPTLTD